MSIDLSDSKASRDQFFVKANGSSLFRYVAKSMAHNLDGITLTITLKVSHLSERALQAAVLTVFNFIYY